MMWNWGMGFAGAWWMLGGVVLLVALVVLVVVAIVRMTGSGPVSSGQGSPPDPIDILRERLARGEITETEFEQAKRTLGYDA